MTWSSRRQLFILGILGAILLAFFAGITFLFTYRAPTCFDGIQNGGETGIDCGGSCALVCTHEARPLVTPLTRYVETGERPDVVAYIRNDNIGIYAENVAYQIDIYDEDLLVVSRTGVIDIPPQSTRAIFIDQVAPVSVPRARAFVSITSTPTFMRDAAAHPTAAVQSFRFEALDTRPRLTATIRGDVEETFRRVPVIAVLFGADGSVVGASRTVVETLPAGGTEALIYTWNEPFSATPTRVEFFPELPIRYGDT